MIVVISNGETLHLRQLIFWNGILRIEQGSSLKSFEIGDKESLISSIIGWLFMSGEECKNPYKSCKTFQEIVICVVIWGNYHQTGMEITRVHVHSTEMTTFEEIVNIMEENVIGIHVDNTLIFKHIPNVEFVECILKVAFV